MQQLEGQGTADPQVPVEPVRALMPSPIGSLGIELVGTTIIRVRVDPPEPERSRFVPLQRVAGSDFLDEVFGRLSEYLAGARRKLDIEYDLGPCGLDNFARRVLKETAKIPYGKTRTYRHLADAVGRPEAYRQVLSVLIENPIPLLIPCHRVVTNKSGLGSYIGGTDRKRWLLEMERGAEAL
jgi:methylated-DNA-[protein]-cysteine S-methyltransferase